MLQITCLILNARPKSIATRKNFLCVIRASDVNRCCQIAFLFLLQSKWAQVQYFYGVSKLSQALLLLQLFWSGRSSRKLPPLEWHIFVEVLDPELGPDSLFIDLTDSSLTHNSHFLAYLLFLNPCVTFADWRRRTGRSQTWSRRCSGWTSRSITSATRTTWASAVTIGTEWMLLLSG